MVGCYRITETSLIDKCEKRVDDYWYDDDSCRKSSSAPWYGTTKFSFIYPNHREKGFKWIAGEKCKITSRDSGKPDEMLPATWQNMGPSQRRKTAEEQKTRQPLRELARVLRNIEIPIPDEDRDEYLPLQG